jgi:hypothetical protein
MDVSFENSEEIVIDEGSLVCHGSYSARFLSVDRLKFLNKLYVKILLSVS